MTVSTSTVLAARPAADEHLAYFGRYVSQVPDGDVLALRFDNWKVVFMEQRVAGTFQIWAEPFVALRVPKLFNLRTDPFERADVTSNSYYDWFIDNPYIVLAANFVMAQFLESFREFPPRQEAASFTIDQAMRKLEAAITSGH